MAQGVRRNGARLVRMEAAAEFLPDALWRRRTLFNREGIRLDAAAGLALTDAEFGDDGMEGMV